MYLRYRLPGLGGSALCTRLGLDHWHRGLPKLGLAEAWGQGVRMDRYRQLTPQYFGHPSVAVLARQSRPALRA